MVIRVHKVLRRVLYIPVAFEENETDIDDGWCGNDGDARGLSDYWIGAAVFDKLRNLPHGYEIICGRSSRKQKAARPRGIWPEIWKMMGTTQKNMLSLTGG